MHTHWQKNTFSKFRVCKWQKISSTSTKVGLFHVGYQNDQHITRNIFHPTFKKVPTRIPTKDICSYTVLLVGPEVPLRHCQTTYLLIYLYHKVVSTSLSHLEVHADFFRLSVKETLVFWESGWLLYHYKHSLLLVTLRYLVFLTGFKCNTVAFIKYTQKSLSCRKAFCKNAPCTK